jgi:hypothetical protein
MADETKVGEGSIRGPSREAPGKLEAGRGSEVGRTSNLKPNYDSFQPCFTKTNSASHPQAAGLRGMPVLDRSHLDDDSLVRRLT